MTASTPTLTEESTMSDLTSTLARKADRAEANVTSARALVLQIVTDGGSASDIVRYTHLLAEAEGAHETYAYALRVAENTDGDHRTVLGRLAEKISEPANDTWSGRGNDVIRSKADGARNVLRDLMFELM